MIRRMGDAALLVELGNSLDVSVNARVHALARRMKSARGVRGVIPGYTTLLVEFDPETLGEDELTDEIRTALGEEQDVGNAERRVVEIPVRYGGEFGPDLEFVARQNGLTTDEVVRIHTATVYQVFMLGFAPGFPYLGILDERIAAPRLESPRKRVPAGSVGIAGRQTGIYPRESPGGWRLIGRTEVRLFDPRAEPPTLLRAGDGVRFVGVR